MPNQQHPENDDFPQERPAPFDPGDIKGYIPVPPPPENEPEPNAGYIPLPPPVVIPEQLPEPQPPNQED